MGRRRTKVPPAEIREAVESIRAFLLATCGTASAAAAALDISPQALSELWGGEGWQSPRLLLRLRTRCPQLNSQLDVIHRFYRIDVLPPQGAPSGMVREFTTLLTERLRHGDPDEVVARTEYLTTEEDGVGPIAHQLPLIWLRCRARIDTAPFGTAMTSIRDELGLTVRYALDSAPIAQACRLLARFVDGDHSTAMPLAAELIAHKLSEEALPDEVRSQMAYILVTASSFADRGLSMRARSRRLTERYRYAYHALARLGPAHANTGHARLALAMARGHSNLALDSGGPSRTRHHAAAAQWLGAVEELTTRDDVWIRSTMHRVRIAELIRSDASKSDVDTAIDHYRAVYGTHPRGWTWVQLIKGHPHLLC